MAAWRLLFPAGPREDGFVVMVEALFNVDGLALLRVDTKLAQLPIVCLHGPRKILRNGNPGGDPPWGGTLSEGTRVRVTNGKPGAGPSERLRFSEGKSKIKI